MCYNISGDKMDYINNLNDEIKEYFKILSSDFPLWLNDYINTKEMQRIGGTSLACGCDYTKCMGTKYFYSNLDHSIGVALIIWNFTHDKKQTLAGLFHDIATPTFKHCIDFMNGDHETQESTEDETTSIIKNSKEIMKFLKRDNIKLEEVCDYKIYPIADNNTPRLSADRFEYTFSNGLMFERIFDLKTIKEIYEDVNILKNEDGIIELGFNTKEICEKYISLISKLWPKWICDEDRTVMQFIADIIKSMNIKGYITKNDLYTLSEKEVIDKILNCDDNYLKESFINFMNATHVIASDKPFDNKYCVSVKSKRRYIIPLVKTNNGTFRINEISEKANKNIEDYLNLKFNKYTGFDFEFTPYR